MALIKFETSGDTVFVNMANVTFVKKYKATEHYTHCWMVVINFTDNIKTACSPLMTSQEADAIIAGLDQTDVVELKSIKPLIEGGADFSTFVIDEQKPMTPADFGHNPNTTMLFTLDEPFGTLP